MVEGKSAATRPVGVGRRFFYENGAVGLPLQPQEFEKDLLLR